MTVGSSSSTERSSRPGTSTRSVPSAESCGVEDSMIATRLPSREKLKKALPDTVLSTSRPGPSMSRSTRGADPDSLSTYSMRSPSGDTCGDWKRAGRTLKLRFPVAPRTSSSVRRPPDVVPPPTWASMKRLPGSHAQYSGSPVSSGL